MQYLVKILKTDSGIGITTLEAASAADARAQVVASGYSVLSVAPAPLLSRLRSSGSSRFPLLLFSQELL